MHRLGLAIGPLDEVDPAEELSRLDAIADLDEGLPETGLGCQKVVLLVGRAHDHRRLEAEALASLDLALEHSEMAKHVREPARRDPVGGRGDLAAAAELGRDDDLPLLLGLADEEPAPGDVDVDEVDVGVPGEHAGGHLPPLLGILDPVHLRPGRADRRTASAVHVDDDVRSRKEEPRAEVGELLVGRPVRIARERAVEVRAGRPEPRVGARGIG